MTLDKLEGARGDLVRADDNWQQWDFPQLLQALRKRTLRGSRKPKKGTTKNNRYHLNHRNSKLITPNSKSRKEDLVSSGTVQLINQSTATKSSQSKNAKSSSYTSDALPLGRRPVKKERKPIELIMQAAIKEIEIHKVIIKRVSRVNFIFEQK